MPAFWRVIRQLRQQGRLPCPSVLLFRTSLRARLFLCRFVQRERVRAERFGGGVLSGVVEPIGAVLTILAAQFVIPVLPYLLSFAAGAMLYVVVEELIPEMSQGEHSNIGTIFFAVGFSMMMVLDVALG